MLWFHSEASYGGTSMGMTGPSTPLVCLESFKCAVMDVIYMFVHVGTVSWYSVCLYTVCGTLTNRE